VNETAYFVDTSYLTELYRVPGRSEAEAVERVRAKFAGAFERGNSIFLPVVCLLELGNHVAQVKNEAEREKVARAIEADVLASVGAERKFLVIDAPTVRELAALVRDWVGGHVRERRGLVDAAVIERARRHKTVRKDTASVAVHIWTRDRQLKACEPDPEPDPFL
jgi:hypothetical protein